MLESLPSKSHGRIFALGVIAALVILLLSLVYLIVSEPLSLLTFLWVVAIIATLPAILFLGYWRAALTNARYYVENLVLEIEWGRLKHSIPLNNIRALQPFNEELKILELRGVSWPGLLAGFGRFQDEEGTFQAKIYATDFASKGLFVKTGSDIYLISPADPADFKTCVEALQVSEEGESTQISSDLPILPPSELWRDRLSQILMATPILLNLLLFGVLTALITGLEEQVPLHFDSSGSVDRTGSAANLLILPTIGLVAWILALVGGLYFYLWRDERPVAQIIWAMTIVIELATWTAVFILLT